MNFEDMCPVMTVTVFLTGQLFLPVPAKEF